MYVTCIESRSDCFFGLYFDLLIIISLYIMCFDLCHTNVTYFVAKLHFLLTMLQIAHFILGSLLFPNNELVYSNAI
jgi:hypothetical protein